MRLVPMTQRQTEGLISGALNGYENFIKLQGGSSSEQAGNGLFEGSSEVQTVVKNAATLGNLLEAMAGLTLMSEFNRCVYAASSFTEDLEGMPNRVWADYDEQSQRFKDDVDKEITKQWNVVLNFNTALSGLKDSYQTGNVLEVAEALETLSEAGNWGSKVPVGRIYGAVESMEQLALFDHYEGINGALNLRMELSDVLDRSRVKSVLLGHPNNPLLTGRKHSPNEGMVYRGPLDHEVMARELLRTYGK